MTPLAAPPCNDAPIVISKRRWLKATAAACVLGGWRSGHARQERIRVLTSYAEALTQRYVLAFEHAHPGARVEILWRQSADALAYLQAGGAQEVDVYWSPAPGNFLTLRKAKLLAPLHIARGALPGVREGLPISDPEGCFAAFELAGYGIAYHIERVAALGVAPPKAWADLAAPAYAGLIQLPIPGRVGFAPGLIDAILQAHGWDDGWRLLAALAANTNFGTGDAAPDADDVVSGKIAARLTIDFFAQAAIASGASIGFAYPARTAYNPAQIGILKAAPNPAGARAFVEFALSVPGQTLLLDPDIRRLPVLPEVYAAHPELAAQPFAPGHLAYDPALTRDRQGLVAAVFEAALVTPHARWQPAWQTLRDLEARGLATHAAVREARDLMTRPLISDADQAGDSLRRLLAFAERPVTAAGRANQVSAPPPPPARLAIAQGWASEIDHRIARVFTLLRSV